MDEVLGQFVGRFHGIDAAERAQSIQPGHLVAVLEEVDETQVQVEGVKVRTCLASPWPGYHCT